MTEAVIEPSEVPELFGISAWPWYLRYLRDPISFFAQAKAAFGPIVALGNPRPFAKTAGMRYFLAIGGRFNRTLLGQPDVFRPSNLVMPGPAGSAHARLRNGILGMYGERHRAHRRVMQPPLSRPAIPGYLARMAEITDEHMDRWQPGSQVDIYAEMSSISNLIDANLLFGSSGFQKSVEMGKAIERWVLLDADSRAHLSYADLPGSRRRRLLRHAEVLERLILEGIARSRAHETPASDVLSMMVQASDRDPTSMTEDDLVAHTAIVYGAGFETTTNALAWTLFLLAQNPDLARQVYEEVKEAVTSWPPDRDMIDKSQALDFAIKEAMRLLPPIPLAFRTALEDTELDGIPIRRDDKVLLAHYETLRDPAIYAEPDRFLPERWKTIKPDTYEYPVFSGGSRLCLGMTFAQATAKLVIARFLQRFSFRVADGARINAEVHLTLRPVPGIPMILDKPGIGFSAARVNGNVTRMVRS